MGTLISTLKEDLNFYKQHSIISIDGHLYAFVDYGLSIIRLLLDVCGGTDFGQSSPKILQEMLKG